jgi:hypothetical protein
VHKNCPGGVGIPPGQGERFPLKSLMGFASWNNLFIIECLVAFGACPKKLSLA